MPLADGSIEHIISLKLILVFIFVARNSVGSQREIYTVVFTHPRVIELQQHAEWILTDCMY